MRNRSGNEAESKHTDVAPARRKRTAQTCRCSGPSRGGASQRDTGCSTAKGRTGAISESTLVVLLQRDQHWICSNGSVLRGSAQIAGLGNRTAFLPNVRLSIVRHIDWWRGFVSRIKSWKSARCTRSSSYRRSDRWVTSRREFMAHSMKVNPPTA